MFTTDTPKNETEINMGAEIIKQICLIKRNNYGLIHLRLENIRGDGT